MRVIARLDVKNNHVIKGIQFEGLRKVGNPNELAESYFHQGIDEIIFMDAVASLYDRNSLFDVVAKACQNTFVPLTLGGGIRSIDDIAKALGAGADKVAINTAAVRNPKLISDASRVYGRQCIVGSIEAKQRPAGGWDVYTDNGREQSGLDVIEWARRLESLGVGELFVTSIDRDGTKRGFDVALYQALSETVGCPIIASGGYGKAEHLSELLVDVEVSAIAFASVLHYKLESVKALKDTLMDHGEDIRS